MKYVKMNAVSACWRRFYCGHLEQLWAAANEGFRFCEVQEAPT
jgi:hypothetical protein